VTQYHPLKTWYQHVDQFLSEIIRHDGRAGCTEQICRRCGYERPDFRCRDCFGGAMLCRSCMVISHASNPLHRVDVSNFVVCLITVFGSHIVTIKEWNGKFFERTSFKALGLRIQLGHQIGERCANPKRAFNDDFVVIDDHAIHNVALDFCDCETAQSLPIQLLRSRWFPATISNPKSAATFNVLQRFQLLSYEGKLSSFEFYHSVARETDNTGVKRPKVHFEHLQVCVL
jgi:hypothetical protein